MPKRSHRESNEDRWRRKMKEYETKLARPKRRRVIYSSSSDTNSDDADDVQVEEHLNYDADELMTLGNGHPTEEFDVAQASNIEQLPDMATTLLESPPSPTPLTPVVDPDLLLALGDSHADTPEWGDDIFQDIAQRWDPILKMGLKKEVKDDIIKKYLFPKNVPLSKPPVLNPELSAMLTEACRNRDNRICLKQNQIGRAITALGKAMSGILTKSMESTEILRTLNDAGKLLADSHYLETDTRRSLITPLLDKSYVTPFKDRQRDKFLFGENLGDFIKSSRGIKKTGQLITPPTPATNLNWKGPPRQQRANRPPAQRSGGQRAAPAPRRAPPPPPAPRRAPPPPAPTRRPGPAPSSTSRSRRAT